MKDKLALVTINKYQMLLRLFCSDLNLLNPYKTFIKLHFKISEKNRAYITRKTISNILCAIIWKIKECYGYENAIKFINMYRLLMIHVKKLCDFDVKNHSRNADKIPLWEDILDKRDHWLKVKDYGKYLIGCVYTMMPPRRIIDYGKMLVVDSVDDAILKNRNYYCCKEGVFLFYIYKTKNVYGKKIIKIIDKLNNIIKEYINMNKIKNNESLFQIKNLDDPIQQVFSNRINKTFDCRVDCLRHSFINFMYRNNFLETTKIEEISDLMGHSVITNLNYRKDNVTDKKPKIKKKQFLNYTNPNKIKKENMKKHSIKIVIVNNDINKLIWICTLYILLYCKL